MGVAAYKGPFGREQAERLLWRAGFGPRKGEAAALAKLGLDGAVRSLTRPGGEKFVGPAPHDDKGRGLAPGDAWGHDHLWWMDRMVRTSRPLVERMTLVWHDWFATSLAGVGSQKLMLNQNKLLRRLSLGSFDTMLREVTKDPAMLLWLSGTENTKWSPNENYARELMELFTLGAGQGYTERDVREQARALTGFDNDWKRGAGNVNFRYDRERHDGGSKRIFGKTRRLRLAGRRPALPPPPEARVRSSSTSSGTTSSRSRPTPARGARSRRCTARTSRSGPSSRRSSATPRSTPGRGW